VTFAVAVPKSLTWPAGLPIGDVWAPVDREREVVFPFDGTVVASAPLGSAALATAALDEAHAIRGSVGRLSTGVRRAVLAEITERIASQREKILDSVGGVFVEQAAEIGARRVHAGEVRHRGDGRILRDVLDDFARLLTCAAARAVGHGNEVRAERNELLDGVLERVPGAFVARRKKFKGKCARRAREQFIQSHGPGIIPASPGRRKLPAPE